MHRTFLSAYFYKAVGVLNNLCAFIRDYCTITRIIYIYRIRNHNCCGNGYIDKVIEKKVKLGKVVWVLFGQLCNRIIFVMTFPKFVVIF